MHECSNDATSTRKHVCSTHPQHVDGFRSRESMLSVCGPGHGPSDGIRRHAARKRHVLVAQSLHVLQSLGFHPRSSASPLIHPRPQPPEPRRHNDLAVMAEYAGTLQSRTCRFVRSAQTVREGLASGGVCWLDSAQASHPQPPHHGWDRVMRTHRDSR